MWFTFNIEGCALLRISYTFELAIDFVFRLIWMPFFEFSDFNFNGICVNVRQVEEAVATAKMDN